MHSALGARELLAAPSNGPLVLREPSRRARNREGARGSEQKLTSERGGLRMEPLPAWLEHRVQKKVGSLTSIAEQGTSKGGLLPKEATHSHPRELPAGGQPSSSPPHKPVPLPGTQVQAKAQ